MKIELVLITVCIDAMENCDAEIADIPGAFLMEHTEKEFHMLLGDEMAEVMRNISPDHYANYVFKRKYGKSMLYVRLNKAINVCLRVVLLFYRKLRKELTYYGLIINNYNSCVTNKLAEGIPMTATWHVDDLHTSHKNPDRVTNLLTHL